MKKNSQLHIVIETPLLESLRKQASEKGTSFAEYCRGKLRENSRLEIIERMLKEVLNKNG